MSSLEKSRLKVMTSMYSCIKCMVCEHTCYIWLTLSFLWTIVQLMWMSSTYGTLRTSSGSMIRIMGACLVYLYSKISEGCRWKTKQVKDNITLLTVIFIGLLVFGCILTAW